jgi:hypothetical protein
LVYVVVDSYVLRDAPGPGSPQSESSGAGAAVVSIAVLPFVDMSQAKDQEYLTDGISEELLNVLAKVEGYKVTGRTSAFAFKARNEDLRMIGQKLGVENILRAASVSRGTVSGSQRSSSRPPTGTTCGPIRTTVSSGTCLRSRMTSHARLSTRYRVTLGGASNDAVVSVPTERKSTPNVEAYTQFLRGQHSAARP